MVAYILSSYLSGTEHTNMSGLICFNYIILYITNKFIQFDKTNFTHGNENIYQSLNQSIV